MKWYLSSTSSLADTVTYQLQQGCGLSICSWSQMKLEARMILLTAFRSLFILMYFEIPSLLLPFAYSLVFGKVYLLVVQFQTDV